METQQPQQDVSCSRGAAAMRWFSRLGEYAQRHATAHTRPGGEAMATVEETVWSPGRAGADREGEPALFWTAGEASS